MRIWMRMIQNEIHYGDDSLQVVTNLKVTIYKTVVTYKDDEGWNLKIWIWIRFIMRTKACK